MKRWTVLQVLIAVVVACVTGAAFGALLGENPYLTAALSGGAVTLFITYDEARAER